MPWIKAYEYKCAKGHAVVYDDKPVQPSFCTSCHMNTGELNRYEFSKEIERQVGKAKIPFHLRKGKQHHKK